MNAFEQLVQRYEELAHPFARSAAMFATGGNEEQAARLLAELDAPRIVGTKWEVVDVKSGVRRKVTWWSWKVWNRTRYYWPQAQARRRVAASFKDFYEQHGETYKAPRPWWLP